MDNLLVIYTGDTPCSPRPEFPGSRTFFSLFDQCGGSLVGTHFLSTSDRRFYENLSSSTAAIALCLGHQAFHATTGISHPILNTRGYLYSPLDTVPLRRKVSAQIGIYKSSRKNHHVKGDPRMGMVTLESRIALGRNLRWIIPTLDPRSDVQAASLEPLPALKADILRALGFLRTFDAQPLSITPQQWPPQEADHIAIDIETFGLTGGVERIGVATADEAWSSHWTDEARSATQALINRARIISGHNLAFDIPRLEREGIQFPSLQARFDTMLAQTLLHPRLHKSLEKSASIYLNLQPWKHLSHTDPMRYNALDAFYTFHLAQAQLDQLIHTGQFRLFTTIIMPATPVLIEMTSLGLKVDTARLAEWQATLTQRLKDLTNTWYEATHDVNPHSPRQLSHYFYSILGIRGPRNSTDEEALHTIIQSYPQHEPLITTLLSLKKISKLLSTYAQVELSHDMCVHPNYLPQTKFAERGTTATGRLASTNPNIQNQPPEAKRLFIARYPGWSLVEFDFSQIELRIAGALSGDRNLNDALKGDVHARTMDLVGCDRVRAKNLIYGSLYGAGPGKLSRILRSRGLATSFDECKSLQAALARAYPGLWAWRTAIANEGSARRFLTNPFGRRRYFFSSDAIPEMYDYLPQSTAADILWSLLRPLSAFAKSFGGNFLTTTHDSGLFEFPPESLTPSLHQSLRDICEQEWPQVAPAFSVPIVIKTGQNWGDLTPTT